MARNAVKAEEPSGLQCTVLPIYFCITLQHAYGSKAHNSLRSPTALWPS